MARQMHEIVKEAADPSCQSGRGRGFAGSKPSGSIGCLAVMSFVCCQVEVSAPGRSPVWRSPTGYGVSVSVM